MQMTIRDDELELREALKEREPMMPHWKLFVRDIQGPRLGAVQV
jgi:hypothetical protein